MPRKFSPRYATLFSVYESYVPFSAMAMQDTCLYIIPLLFLFIPTTIRQTTIPSYYFVHPVAPILFIVLAALFPSPPSYETFFGSESTTETRLRSHSPLSSHFSIRKIKGIGINATVPGMTNCLYLPIISHSACTPFVLYFDLFFVRIKFVSMHAICYNNGFLF